ncbi:hypothetical protein [Stenotrophomonas sp. SMYL11]|uniref:hypothetical protein n=1 Tax=Stenotrophomonas sp. SMYL11 TaxID=3076042 RepID=UPI002E79E819|nr:hypothetical protein [Stenotrophomonas sp. SMYL11]
MADGWAKAHGAALGERERRARLAAQRSGKPWTLHADEQTRAVLADCPKREVGAATAAKYRRAYDNLRATGQTPLEAATTRAHWDFLRTATRYCVEQDVRAWRASSERARERGDIASAQRRTERAFRLAAVLDEMFLQSHRQTWTHKAAEMKAAGTRPVSKSKRSTGAPAPDLAIGVLLGRQERVLERHAERLAVLALTGCRPAELRAGVSLRVGRTAKGRRVLHATLHGAKWNGTNRGQQARGLAFPADKGAAAELAARVEAKGGHWTMATTEADVRSLNRALKAGAGISCYSFRHQQGSELKAAVSSGTMSAEEAAAAMGHASTASLAFYGSRSKARGGRKLRARASEPVRTVPVSFAAKAAARAARAARFGATPRPAARPPAAPRAAMSKPVGPLARGPKPPGR